MEPLEESVAKLAGVALAALSGATVIDAIVMASASLRGDVVYTSDVDDLMALQTFFDGSSMGSLAVESLTLAAAGDRQ